MQHETKFPKTKTHTSASSIALKLVSNTKL